MTYQEYKQEVEAKYGPAINDFDNGPNQSAKMLLDFKAKHMQAKAKEAKAAVKAIVASNQEKVLEVELPESKLLDKDLKGFTAIQQDILRAYFANRSAKPSALASQFNQTYQFVAGFLKSNKVQLLANKYFVEDLDEYTRLGLLALVKAKDPRAILAAAEYNGVLSKQGIEDSEFKSEQLEEDEFTKDCLTLLADWLTDPNSHTLTLSKP